VHRALLCRTLVKRVVSVGFSLALAIIAVAANTLEKDFTCPIDGNHWRERVETSSRATGLRLDMKKLGDVVQPPTLPQCPKCRFVLFTETVEEPLLKKLKPFVLGGDYQLIAAKSPTYACLAHLQEFLHAPPIYGGYSFLRASWQVEEKPAICERYLHRAHEKFVQVVADLAPDNKDRLNVLLLLGELERRLQKWPEAEQRFRALLDSEDLKADARKQSIVNQQLQLIAKRDPHPHPVASPVRIPVEPTSSK
jgi:hypothetical protein